MAKPFEDGWVPAQAAPPCVVDLRGAAFGPRGYKLKNEERFCPKRKAEDMEIVDDSPMEVGHIPTVRDVKRAKLNIIGAGKVSQRMWKVPGDRAASRLIDTSRTTWVQKMEKKRNKQEFQEVMKQSREVYGAKQKAIREQRQRARERKEENRKKSSVVQKISNPKTLKRMMKSKKERSKLMMTDDS